MEVQLTSDQKAFVRQAIDSGRLQREEDVVKEALSLWEERERSRAELIASVDDAEASLASGEGRIITRESMRELAHEVKRRGATASPPSARPAYAAPPRTAGRVIRPRGRRHKEGSAPLRLSPEHGVT
jgi:Arc/MetJ-type ribon-helix-helix transcriptional regulator